MSDAPTQRFETPPGDGAQPPGDDATRRNRGLLIALIAIGAALVVGIVVLLLVLLLGGGKPVAVSTTSPAPTRTGDSPSPAPTPTQTAPTPAPTPTTDSGTGGSGGSGGSQPTGGQFTLFQPETTVQCSQGGPSFTPPPIPIKIAWKTIRTDSVWIVQGTSDAADSQFMQLPVSGDHSSFPYEIDFPCGQASATYNLTLVGSDGKHVQRMWTVTNTGDMY